VTGPAATAALDSNKFRAIILSLRLRAILHDIPELGLHEEPKPVDWNFALLCASALTAEQTEEAQIAVLRVASGCLSDSGTTEQQRVAALALLERDGNDPAVRLAIQKELVPPDSLQQFPVALQLEVARARMEHSVRLSTGLVLPVNSFQSALWEEASTSSWLSVSAPTSSGKSRIVREWFLEQLRLRANFSAVYLVPTRALVEEVAGAFRKTVQKSTSVFVMPWDTSLHEAQSRVLVLTQERLHLIQSHDPNFHVDLLFVDEAHSLGGAHRGILLQQVIDVTVAANPGVRVILASPLSSNPELLLAGTPQVSRARAFTSETVTVNQNVLHVERVKGKPKIREVALVHRGEPQVIGSITFEKSQGTGIARSVAAIAHTMGKANGGNLIYANRPIDAERIADCLFDLESESAQTDDPDIQELQALIKSSVHPNWDLIRVLNRRIGFHYGNMPLAIRAEIERLFGEEKINYLICTSTLLEGVNLPCKNIFIRAPQKGSGNAMSPLDFWNLAGRAGRWGREFQGNVVCIDTSDPEGWPEIPITRGLFPLVRAVPNGLQYPTGLKAYLDTAHESPNVDAGGENLFSYLATRLVNGSDLSGELTPMDDLALRARVLRELKTAVGDSGLPASLIRNHAGISPIAMGKLLAAFRESALTPEQLSIPNPRVYDAKERYQQVYVRLGATMTSAFGASFENPKDDKRKWQIAGLVINWMKGLPLRVLIDQRQNGGVPLATAIREVMKDIETLVRFQSAKYLACYTDVLNVHAEQLGVAAISPDFDISMMLELGVSEPRQVALMSAGLSRTTTLQLSQYVGTGAWSPAEAMAWLRNLDLETLPIPAALKREILQLTTSVFGDAEDPEN